MSNNVLPKEVSAGLGLGTSTLRNDLQKVQGGGGGELRGTYMLDVPLASIS